MSHSRSRKLGMEFVIPVPVPKNWEWNLSFPFPFPKVGNAIFHSRSRFQNLGMGWAIPVPVPKVQKSFPLTPAEECTKHSNTMHWRLYQTLHCTVYWTTHKDRCVCSMEYKGMFFTILEQWRMFLYRGALRNVFLQWSTKEAQRQSPHALFSCSSCNRWRKWSPLGQTSNTLENDHLREIHQQMDLKKLTGDKMVTFGTYIK